MSYSGNAMSGYIMSNNTFLSVYCYYELIKKGDIISFPDNIVPIISEFPDNIVPISLINSVLEKLIINMIFINIYV